MPTGTGAQSTTALLENHSVKSRDNYDTISIESGEDDPRRLAHHEVPVGGHRHPDRSLSTLLGWLRYSIWFIGDQWFLFSLSFFIILASQVQVPIAQQAMKETVVTYLCVSVIFFVTGCTLSTRVLVQNYSRWRIHLFCQIQSFVLTSAMMFGAVSACASNADFMDPGLLVGLILTGCVPTTISSNIVMTRQANGNQALTVVESTLGNFLGPFIAPLLILMYLSPGAWYSEIVPDIETDDFGDLYRRVFKQLGLSIFLPLAVGQGVRSIFPNTTQKVFTEWKVSKLGSVSLLFILWQTFDGAFATGAFDSIETDNIVFLIFISIAFYAVWTVICFSLSLPWLSKQDAIAVAYIVPAKTSSIGVPLSEAMFVGLPPIVSSKLQIPMVVFQGLQVALGSLLTLAFRQWVEKEAGQHGQNLEEANRSSEERVVNQSDRRAVSHD